MIVFISVAEENLNDRNEWLHGQAVKTSPFHGGNPGSIPGGVNTPMWLKWQRSRFVISRLSVRVRSSAWFLKGT